LNEATRVARKNVSKGSAALRNKGDVREKKKERERENERRVSRVRR